MKCKKNKGPESDNRITLKPRPIVRGMTVDKVIESSLFSFNAGTFRKACELFVKHIAREDVRIGVSIAGALIPAGIGRSCLIPLIKSGMIDWIVSTGANLYHDLHHVLGYEFREGRAVVDDEQLREDGVIRIYDIFLDYDALLDTDNFVRETLRRERGNLPEPCSSADIHALLGKEIIKIKPSVKDESLLAVAYEAGVPIHTSSPADSSIGMNIAALMLENKPVAMDTHKDINEVTSYVYDIKKRGGKSAVLLLGGGSPKNFVLQTEPHIQEVLGLPEAGHDFFIQFTDARPDTGGLSGATPSEAVSWGKIDPSALSKTIVSYGDCSLMLPFFVSYILNRSEPRAVSGLLEKRKKLSQQLKRDYRKIGSYKKKSAG
ncbi:MAG: deoxyhypusine synthase [Nitrospiraceae bacterium]|nr:MAG: deoxyhypusine synthase [Nitrospiraceae bacterium]